MPAGSPAHTLLAWYVRAVLRVLCFLAVSVGTTMVALARAFRACTRASSTYGPAVIPAQLVLLLAWAPARVLFLALFGAAKTAYRADIELRRWAEVN